MQDVPRSSLAFWVDPEVEGARKDADEEDYPDIRYTTYRRDRHIHKDEELSDSEDEDKDGTPWAVLSNRRQNRSPAKPHHSKYDTHGEDVEYATYGRARPDTERPGAPEKLIGGEQHANKLSPMRRLMAHTNTEVSPASDPASPQKLQPRNPADDPRCESCKTGKTKCDKARPFCSTCIRRNRQDRCLYRRLDGTVGPDPGAEAALALAEEIGRAASNASNIF